MESKARAQELHPFLHEAIRRTLRQIQRGTFEGRSDVCVVFGFLITQSNGGLLSQKKGKRFDKNIVDSILRLKVDSQSLLLSKSFGGACNKGICYGNNNGS